MRIFLYFFTALIFISCSKNIVSERDSKNRKLVGKMVNNQKQGVWRYYDEKDRLYMKSSFKNNVETGISKVYHENGKLRQIGKIDNGKQVGSWKFYHQNGKFYGKGNLVNGKMDGKWIWYFNNGQLHTIRHYADGRLLNVDFSKNRKGETIESGSFKNENGQLIIYETQSEKDTVEYILNYKNGLIVP